MSQPIADRNLFDKKVLPNGITLYTKIVDTAYSMVELTVPVGSQHNTGQYLPGTFHFLEHMCLERSELFPERHSFKKFLGLKSASSNAGTGLDNTTYYFSTPNQHIDDLIPGFLSSVFQPVFSQDDLDLQKTIISNERQRKERWFPGNTELGQYLNTKWMWDCPVSLNQRLGSDHNLADMTLEKLKLAHKNYFNSDITVLFIGQQPSPLLEQQLADLKVNQVTDLDSTWDSQHWVNKDYHVKAFRDVNRHQLYFANFQPHTKPSMDQNIAKHFILAYLLNHIHGPIYHWLREDKGWVYEVNFDSSSNWEVTEWGIMLPLNNQQQVDIVRQELWPRVEQALQDTHSLNLEVTRALGMRAYHYQTTASFLNSASRDLDLYGRIIGESEYVQAIEKCRDRDYILGVYHKLFSPTDIGSFCAVPEAGE